MTQRRVPGEFELIDRFRRILPPGPTEIVIGPGDDCAAVAAGRDRLLLLTCDVLVEGRHFRRDAITPHDLGRRLAAVNLSDVAAMGGSPGFALLSLVLPDADAETWAEGVLAGVSEELAAHGAWLVGGNLSGSESGIVTDLALTGEVARSRVLRRAGAAPGDAILVTGHVGSSAAGARLLSAGIRDPSLDELLESHRRPRPRLVEGRAIAASGLARCMIDVSDGIASDLLRLCVEGAVGAEVQVERLPVLEATRKASRRLGIALEELTVSGGEDYELLFTAPATEADELARRVEGDTGTPVRTIGRIVAGGPRIRYLDARGGELPSPPSGWDHFTPSRP